jgi:hypothetical protein
VLKIKIVKKNQYKEVNFMAKQKIDLIRQALTASESSIRLARQLLSDLEREAPRDKPQTKSVPGVIGIFDGLGMVTENNEKHPVPENYASKSILVVGDTLKLYKEGGEQKFKQIEHVKRHKTTGILTKKDGKWAVVTPEGSYKVLAASVGHYEGNVGDEALVQLPARNLQVPWAAVEKVAKKEQSGEVGKPLPQTPASGEAKKTEGEVKVEKVAKEETKSVKEEKPKEEIKIKKEEPKKVEAKKELKEQPKTPKQAEAPKVEKTTPPEEKKQTQTVQKHTQSVGTAVEEELS